MIPPDWPNRQWSRELRAGGIPWHVQVAGSGPAVLLLHGTASSAHTWRGMLPALAERFTVVAPDLPGHGFTARPARARLSMGGMAGLLRSLLQVLGLRPVLAAGHSAGAAVAIRMALDGAIDPAGLVSLNGALMPLSGAAGQFFSPLAKLLVGLPGLPTLFAWRARDERTVAKLLADTGSVLDPEGVRLYARLLRDPKHDEAALAMMSQWDLGALVADLPRLRPKLLLLAGAADRAVPPAQAEQVARLVPGAAVEVTPGLGHLSHEERAADTAARIDAFAREIGL